MTTRALLSCLDCPIFDEASFSLSLIRSAEIATVSALRVPWGSLRNPTRGRQAESFARQVAIYLPRLIWGFNIMDLSRASGRERSTVRHACLCIAAARRDGDLDQQLAILEQAIRRSVEATLGPICR